MADPMGAPRQSRRDAWDPRDCVLRYREFRDKAREACTGFPDRHITGDFFGIFVFAHIRMPASWGKKKRALMAGQIHRQKPDEDNILKGVKDAIFAKDEGVSGGTCWKFWAYDDDTPRLDVFLLGFPTVAAGSVPAPEDEEDTMEPCPPTPAAGPVSAPSAPEGQPRTR